MDKKRAPIILLLEDELTEYNNWKKWIKLSNNNAILLYSSDIDSAIEEIKNNDIDIYIIDIFLSYDNGISFLEIIKNKRGLKIVVTTSKDLADVSKIYELGAILLNKQNNIKDSLKIVELVFTIWNLGKLAESDSNQNILKEITEELGNNFSDIIPKLEILENEVEKVKVYILGNYEITGLKTKVEQIESYYQESKNKNNIAILISFLERSNIFIKIIVMIFLILIGLTLPILAIYKLFTN